ncbi:MAG: hypothetical protein WCL12_06450, partial [Actinomycetes bacterium]
ACSGGMDDAVFGSSVTGGIDAGKALFDFSEVIQPNAVTIELTLLAEHHRKIGGLNSFWA